MIEEEKVEKPAKLNNLNTKFLPPVFMLMGGLVAFIMCMMQDVEMVSTLLILLISFFVFAIIGTIIKSIVDKFNMNVNYDDLFDDDDEGDIVEK